MPCIVTIDGPAAAGKSTTARLLAARLEWRFLDTGALYRAVTLAAIRHGVNLADEEALSAMVATLSVSLPPDRVLLGEEDITRAIRGVEVTRASRFAADSPSVRRRLMIWQRAFAAEYDVVTEGRDQGTLIFPDAFCKFYLTASEQERALRRVDDFQSRGEAATFESVLRDQRERDVRDAARAIAPMKPADDALVIDSTGLSVEEVVDRMAREVDRRRGKASSPAGTSGEVTS